MTYFKTVISAILLLCCASLSYGQVQEGDTTEVVSLEGTVLTAEKKPVVYRLDRKRVSGSSSISASGGSAVDILKAMPSVRVDADGKSGCRRGSVFQRKFRIPGVCGRKAQHA